MLVETLLRRALDRGRLDRYRRTEAFQTAVVDGLAEVRSQPFGSPLMVAQAHAANSWLSPEQRCVWEEVASRVSRGHAAEPRTAFRPGDDDGGFVSASEPEPTSGCAPPPAVAAPSFRRYIVGLRTDAGPASPAGLLRLLTAEGQADVAVECDHAGDPFLLYRVEASLHASSLASLSEPTVEPPSLHCAASERGPMQGASVEETRELCL